MKEFEISQIKLKTEKDFIEKLRENPVELIEERQSINPDELKRNYRGNILVCDAYVDGIEEFENNNFCDGRISVIDHHIPLKQFEKNISSVNLAIEFVEKNGSVPKDTTVIVNHTDCDSILSSLIMKGILSPDKKFGEAAISADHTGKENKIADLLQSLQYERDIEFSLRNLQLLLNKKSLEQKAQKLFQERIKERENVKKIVENENFKEVNGIVYTEFEKKIDPTLLISLFPKARIIIGFSPHLKNTNCLEVRIRRGMSAPEWLCLNKLGIEDFDPNWGGRWNAGSNKRSGGTKLSADEYVKKLNEIINI